MRSVLLFGIAAGLCASVAAQAPKLHAARDVRILMGTRFEIAAYAERAALADSVVRAGVAEVQRIERLISSWDSTSQTSAINRAPVGEPVPTDAELLALIARAKKLHAYTEGAFDATAGGGLRGLYAFRGQDTTLPSAAQLADCSTRIDASAVVVDRAAGTATRLRPHVRLDFGGIGKGYAANRVRALMRAVPGVHGGVVNAAGDIAAFGTAADGKPWRIGIADPRDPDRWLGQVAITDAAVVTSGDYEKYFTHAGRRYAHIVDPRTCLPTTAVRSATVVCPDAELADALATACFVLGPERAVALIDATKSVEALIVTDAGVLVRSKGLTLQPYAPGK